MSIRQSNAVAKRRRSPDHAAITLSVARLHSQERSGRLTTCALVLVVGVVAMMIRPEVAWQIASALGLLEGAIVVTEVRERKRIPFA